MEIYDVLFIINLLLLGAITIWNCFKKEWKAVIYNVVILLFFITVRALDVHYVTIRTNLYYALGEERFNILKELLSVVLFFGTSLTLGVQLISDIVSIVLLVLLATKVAVYFVKKVSKDIFSMDLSYEDDCAKRHFAPNDSKLLFLVLGRLLN